MREPTPRPSPSAPPSTTPSNGDKPGKAADWTPVEATPANLPIVPGAPVAVPLEIDDT